MEASPVSPEPRVLLLGASGQVGTALRVLLPVEIPPREEADLSRPEGFGPLIGRYRPALVINAAADTAVDRAETDPEPARVANAEAPAVLADVCRGAGARLIHFSTDYVFPGDGTRSYTEDDPVAPVNAYGRFKLEGEQAVLAADPRHLVFRLSWVYSTHGRNFALTMLRLAREGKPIRVVDDQVGSPTYAHFIASAVATISERILESPGELGGLYHLSAAGETSWHGFAVALLNEVLGEQAREVEPISTAAFPTPAARPRYSVLDNAKIAARFGIEMPNWRSQLTAWASELAAG